MGLYQSMYLLVDVRIAAIDCPVHVIFGVLLRPVAPPCWRGLHDLQSDYSHLTPDRRLNDLFYYALVCSPTVVAPVIVAPARW